MKTPGRSKKRWLIGSAIAIVIFSILLLWAITQFRDNIDMINQRNAQAEKTIQKLGGSIEWTVPGSAYFVAIYGMATELPILVSFSDPTFPPDQWLKLNDIPPYPIIMSIDGSSFNRDSLTYLKEVKALKFLIVTDTSVTQDELQQFKNARPDVDLSTMTYDLDSDEMIDKTFTQQPTKTTP